MLIHFLSITPGYAPNGRCDEDIGSQVCAQTALDFTDTSCRRMS